MKTSKQVHRGDTCCGSCICCPSKTADKAFVYPMDLVGTLGFVEVHESKHQVVLACE